MSEALIGKTVLVTGAAKRIGRAVAFEFARHGANVAITFSTSVGEAERTVEAIAAEGVEALSVRCDLRNPVDVREAATAVVERFGGIDILVNNAGVFESAALEAVTIEAWDRVFETNTRGPFLMAQAAYPFLKAARGRIINIGSLGGLAPWATHAHYCTSKAALHMLSQTMAKAWAPEITVNCIAPGMIVQGEVGAMYEEFARRTPMQTNGTAEDVAAAAIFFAGGPRFITGQMLVVDGGLGL